MAFQFPKFEFVLTVALLVGWFLDVRYGAILMLLSGPFYFPRIRRYIRNSIKNALLALSELFSRRGAAAAAVAVLPYLAMIYLGIISQPQRRDAAVLIVLFTVIFVTAPFLVYYPSASDSASPTAAADSETDPSRLRLISIEQLRAALEAAGASTEGNKTALVDRLAALRRQAKEELLAVGSRVVTKDGAYGSIVRLPEGTWWRVRIDGEDTDRSMRLAQFELVTSAPVASLLPLVKDCACAASASALLYLLLDYLWIFILHLTSSAHWRLEATISVVLSTLVGAGVYCLYRHFYCRTLPYKLPPLPPDVPKFVRTNGDKVRDYLEPPKTVEDLLERYGLSDYAALLQGRSLAELQALIVDSDRPYDELSALGINNSDGRRRDTRLLEALRELPPGPNYYRDLLAGFKATGELPEKLGTCKMIPSGSEVVDVLTKSERDLYEKTTGINATCYKAPSLLDRPILHRIYSTAAARRDAYFKAFHAENEARTLLELPWTRYRMNLLRARRETEPLSADEVTELATLEEELPGLELAALQRDLKKRGFVQKVPTEKRPENWTDEDEEGHERTMEFLKKPQSEQIEILKNILPKLTSCACEIGWAAAILALWALYLMLEESGNTAAANDAFDKLLKALVRVNFWYSREHFLLCDVPEDAVKAAVGGTTADAVDGAHKKLGLKIDLEERQQVLGFPLSATLCGIYDFSRTSHSI